MEIHNLLIIQTIIVLVSMEFFPLPISLGIISFFIITLNRLIKDRNIILIIIPILIIIRMYTGIIQLPVYKEEVSGIRIRIVQGKGEIKSINGKYLKSQGFLNVENTQDGEYLIDGTINSIKELKGVSYYTLEKIKKIKIEKNFIQQELENLVEKRIKNFTYKEKGLYRGIVIGDRTLISNGTKELFLKNGLMHILAISGLHIGVIIYIFEKLGGRLPVKKRVKEFIILFFLTLYYLGIRGTPSVDRAYIMGIIYIFGKIIYEKFSLWKGLILAFIVSIIKNPTVYKEVSFIMSYWAMGFICIWTEIKSQYLFHYNKKKRCSKTELDIKKTNGKLKLILGKLLDYIVFSVYIQLAMSPLIYLIFKKFSIIAIIKSIILTPLGIIYIYSSFLLLIFPIQGIVSSVYWILIKSMEIF